MKLTFSKSLRSRFLIVLLGLAALPALLIGGLAYRNARRTIEARTVAQLTSIADLKKERIATWLEARIADVRLLADNFLNEEHFTEILDPRVDPGRRAAFAGFLTDNLISIQRAHAGYSEIMFADTAGRVILSTDPTRIGKNLSAYPALAMTLSSPTGQFVEDIHSEGEGGPIEMAFGHVLRKVDLATSKVLPDITGAVIIRVRMDETIYPLIRSWPGMGRTGETLLVRSDRNDTLFLNPLRFKGDAALNLRVPKGSPNAKPAHLASAGREGIIQTPDYRGVMVLAAHRATPQTGWGFVAKQDLSEAFEPVAALTRQWIFLTALVLLAAVIAAVILARALTGPLARLVADAQAVAAGNFENSVPIKRADSPLRSRRWSPLCESVRTSSKLMPKILSSSTN